MVPNASTSSLAHALGVTRGVTRMAAYSPSLWLMANWLVKQNQPVSKIETKSDTNLRSLYESWFRNALISKSVVLWWQAKKGINSELEGANTCRVLYIPSKRSLYLMRSSHTSTHLQKKSTCFSSWTSPHSHLSQMLEPPCHLQESTLKWCARNLNLLKFLNTHMFVQILVQVGGDRKRRTSRTTIRTPTPLVIRHCFLVYCASTWKIIFPPYLQMSETQIANELLHGNLCGSQHFLFEHCTTLQSIERMHSRLEQTSKNYQKKQDANLPSAHDSLRMYICWYICLNSHEMAWWSKTTRWPSKTCALFAHAICLVSKLPLYSNEIK